MGGARFASGQVFQCLGERDLAIRCFRAALRQQCTYPGCNDMAKDACNLLHRALLQELHPGRGGAGGTGKGGRYGVGDVVFGCLTTAGSYRTRARAVKETWRKHTELFHLYGDAPDESLPITPYAALEGGGLSEEQEFLKEQIEAADYASSLAKRHPEASWYYLGGDDNFVVPENLVAQLQGLDAASVLMVGGPLGSHVGVGKYPSGGCPGLGGSSGRAGSPGL
ncbi:hypothetical protein T484DRAFT_1760225 [Baffinella frigidus]|nr:hypothetical protein T484DRAFT_1760225 [Cryptophyta sp. CCMP2293]